MQPALVLDTSIMVAAERGDFDRLPTAEAWYLSAMTVAELNIGLLRATSVRDRQHRLDTLQQLGALDVLPFDETTARTYAELLAWAETEGFRPSIPDGIIAATAATNGMTLVTLDTDVSRLTGFAGLDVFVL